MDERTIFNDLDTLETYLHQQSIQRMQAKSIPYERAFLDIAHEQPGLEKLREVLRSRRQGRCDAGTVTQIDAQLKEVDGQLDRLARETMAARPELPYHEALKLVASERPDIMCRRRELYRRISG